MNPRARRSETPLPAPEGHRWAFEPEPQSWRSISRIIGYLRLYPLPAEDLQDRGPIRRYPLPVKGRALPDFVGSEEITRTTQIRRASRHILRRYWIDLLDQQIAEIGARRIDRILNEQEPRP